MSSLLNNVLSRLYFLIPVLITLVLIIFANTDYGYYYNQAFLPELVIISCFYWILYFPKNMNMLSVFLVGIFADLVASSPVGITSFSLILSRFFLRNQREPMLRFGFYITWLGFIVFLSIYSVSKWFLYNLMFYFFDGQIILMGMPKYFLSILFYPLFHSAFNTLKYK